MLWEILSEENYQTHKEVIRVLLNNRHISAEETKEFFATPSPLDLLPSDVGIDEKKLQKAVSRIEKAIEKKEDVVIFGDYDADGVCATAVLWEALKDLGLEARVFIPDRAKHGYGMSDRSLGSLLENSKPDLIITVDNGIVAHEAVNKIVKQGIDVIITDHHSPELDVEHPGEFLFPNAHAFVHTTQLCGTTVAWFLARALKSKSTERTLDLCGIATISDQMPLLHANRSFASFGIKALQTTKRPALVELCQLANIHQGEINEKSINFVIGPRINAMGRLSSATDAFHALVSDDPSEIQRLASLLHTTNTERQGLTWEMVDNARLQAKTWENEHVVILASPDYHEGVIGLIAGKMVEEYYKPAIVMSIGETFVKASARSVAGVNIVEFIRTVRDDLLEVGGHPMAAGFGLLPEKVEIVQQKLFALAKSEISAEMLTPSLTVEVELNPILVTLEFIQFLEKMAPFGNGNVEPVFALRNMKILQSKVIGREGKHVKLLLRSANDLDGETKPLDCLAFGWGERQDQLLTGMTVDVAGTLGLNVWHGNTSMQMILKDAKISENI